MTNTTNTNATINHANAQEEMTMTIRQYAEEIARNIKGAEVRYVEKANGVILTGVLMPLKDTEKGNNRVSANFYVDDLYRDGVSIEDATRKAQAFLEKETPAFDLEWIMDFENVKPHLRARLYNKATRAEVQTSAEKYGLSDLIIVPYIDEVIKDGSVKVTNSLVKTWDVDPQEVIEIAEENSRKCAVIKDMNEMMFGFAPAGMPKMLVVMNDNIGMYGAYAVIPKMDALYKEFPNGFVVLPSSVHEVIVVDINEKGAEELTAMVQGVNATEVSLEEQLSDHAYTFCA